MEVGNLAQAAVHRADDEVLFPQEGVDHQSVACNSFAEEHDQHVFAGRLRALELEDLAGQHDSHVLAVDLQVLAILQRTKLVAGEPNQAVYPVMGESVRLARDLHNHRAEYGERYRKLDLKTRPMPQFRVNPDMAADRLNHGLNDIESDASAGNFGNLGSGGESRKKQEIQEFGIGQFAGHVGGGVPALDDLGTKSSRSIPRPSSETVIESSPAL